MSLLDASVFVHFGDLDGVGAYALHFRVRDPFDVAIAHNRFEHSFRVADAAESKVADIGFGGDKGDRDAIPDLALAQVGDDGQSIFIRRAEA